jgi:D-alanyl-D-alanine dipeptidase
MKRQITNTLSRIAWQDIIINESGEELVLIRETTKLKIDLIKKHYKPIFYLRKSVAEKLFRVSERLPEGIVLILIEGYRTLRSQQDLWDKKFEIVKIENPSWSNEEVEKQVRLVVAKPLPLANHHCGGAVDVTLGYSDGTLLDMGTPYPSDAMSADWYIKFQMLSNEITDVQKQNRKILRDAMETEDFVWYPGEWWHYCWGDRMWAVYSGQSECIYGPIELSE